MQLGRPPNVKFIMVGQAVAGYRADEVILDNVEEWASKVQKEMYDEWVFNRILCRLTPDGVITTMNTRKPEWDTPKT